MSFIGTRVHAGPKTPLVSIDFQTGVCRSYSGHNLRDHIQFVNLRDAPSDELKGMAERFRLDPSGYKAQAEIPERA